MQYWVSKNKPDLFSMPIQPAYHERLPAYHFQWIDFYDNTIEQSARKQINIKNINLEQYSTMFSLYASIRIK